jgi:acyl dehydratase
VLRCETEVLEARASQSRPDMGIVRSRLTTFNQQDEPVLTFIANALIARRRGA